MGDSPLRCSFCNKDQAAVRKLIAGPNDVCICDECVTVCVEIIKDDPQPNERRVETPRRAHEERGLQVRCALCGMPIPAEHAVLVPERGPLCVGCVGEIDAALARERDRDSEH